MLQKFTSGTHSVTATTTDRPGDPFADVRADLTLDITGSAVVHVYSNVRIYASGNAKVFIYGNASVMAWGNAEVFFLGDGCLNIGGHATAHVSALVRTIADEHAEVHGAGETFAYGQCVVYAGTVGDRVHRGSPYTTVHRGGIVAGPVSTELPRWAVSR